VNYVQSSASEEFLFIFSFLFAGGISGVLNVLLWWLQDSQLFKLHTCPVQYIESQEARV
jgi:hypothetical protein